MTEERRQSLHTIAGLALVVIGHAGLIAALAFAGEWRVWRLIVDVVAQLYALVGIGWIGWHVFAAPRQLLTGHRTARGRSA